MTAAVNASVQPVLDRYLDAPAHASSSGKGFDRDILVMQGNGGTISSQFIAHAAVNTVMSGPASGVMAAAYTGRASGHAQPHHLRHGRHLDRCRPDRGRRAAGLGRARARIRACRSTCRWSTCTRSAPAAARSPRSMPPACCGSARRAPARGRARSATAAAAREPTITDANLILGRLNPDRLLGVDHPVTLDHVRGADRRQGRQAARPRRRCGGRRHPAHRQRPHGRRHPAGVAVARPRSARLRAVRLRRRGALARHGAGARARDPDGAGAGAARHHQCAGLRRGRPAPRLCAHRQQAAVGARRCRRSPASMPSRPPQGDATIAERGRAGARAAPRAERRHAVPGPEPHPVGRRRPRRHRRRRACARPSPPPTGSASASSWRRSRRCWSTCTPR